MQRSLGVLRLGTLITPNHHGLWLFLGIALRALGCCDDADDAWQRAIDLAPPKARATVQRIIGFQINHRPNNDAHRLERIFQRMKLRPQCRLYAFACLIATP